MILNNQNNQNLISQISQFANKIKQSNKSPEEMLDELIASGKYSQDQINQARSMAQSIIHLFRK